MTCFGLEALAEDPGTAVIVLVSKPPHPDVLARLDAALAAVGKPVVVCALGLPARPRGDSARWVSTLVDAAEAAAALAGGRTWTSRPFADPRGARQRRDRCRTVGLPGGPGILGLYTGGTLAHEARFVLEPLVGAVSLDDGAAADSSSHRVLDLGDDAHTVGRPHPMIDATGRVERIHAAGDAADVGVVLLDVVLGAGAHPDPAGPVTVAVERARQRAAARGRRLGAVASVIGAPRDPQGLAGQIARLEAAGVEALPSNAEILDPSNSLNNVANLHLIMAIRNCEFFEVLLPAGAQKGGLVQDIEVDGQGLVHAPTGPGLGAHIDFDLIARRTLAVLH
jgi:FdrA protein